MKGHRDCVAGTGQTGRDLCLTSTRDTPFWCFSHLVWCLRLVIGMQPERSCWGWAPPLPGPLIICQIGTGWHVWASVSEAVISNSGAPQGSVLHLHSCSHPTPPILNPAICRSSLMTLLRSAVLEIDWNQSAGGEQTTLWSGAAGIVFSRDPAQIVVDFLRTRLGSRL